MTGQLTTTGRNRAINAGIGNSESAVATKYLALATALPTGPGTATLASFAAHELTTGGYSRQEITFASSPSGGTIAHSGTVLFGAFSADPPEVAYCWQCDTSTGTTGSVIAYWTLDTPLDAASGDFIQFSPGEIKMAVDAC
jgi:hypothetical protein